MTCVSACLRLPAGVLLALALIAAGAPWNSSPRLLAQEQTLFAAFFDAAGNGVTDVRPDEVIVQVDGVECRITSFEPVRLPVRLTIFIDNGDGSRESLQHMREGLKEMLTLLPEDMEIALLTTSGRPQWITRHTTDRAELTDGIGLVVTSLGSGGTFLDALIEEGGRLDDDDEREYIPIILMIATDSPDVSTGQQNRFQEMTRRMVANQAMVHTRMFVGRGAQAGAQLMIGESVAKVTGGSYQTLGVATAFRTLLPDFGADLARKHLLVRDQYRITYLPPDGAAESAAISMGVARSGIQMVPTLDGNIP